MPEMKPASQPPQTERIADRTLSTVLSLYISNERMQEVFANWTKDKRQSIQRGNYQETQKLREAIDPLFNDVAMRDRNSTLDEFLIDVEGNRVVETIKITVPQHFHWRTEGKTTEVDLGASVSHTLQCRMFWYVHSNGSLSYHIAFRLEYEHRFTDYYYLSILQKLFFPKEFYPENVTEIGSIYGGKTGLWVLDTPMVEARDDYMDPSSAMQQMTFWAYIRDRFGRHVHSLSVDKKVDFKIPLPADRAGIRDRVWIELIEADQVEVIEVPGLNSPAARSVFLFRDRSFWRLLQQSERDKILGSENYGVREHIVRGDVETIDAATFNAPPAKSGAFDIQHYFLSGFLQNIIDFHNQDASEIRDGTDPIFPSSDAQKDEAFFVCYANGRSLYEIVKSSRSLDAGAGYIGMCPYLFLIHLMALHNEFVVRRYEMETKTIEEDFDDPRLTDLGNLERVVHSIQTGELGPDVDVIGEINKITNRFHAFRYRAFTIFIRHLYDNTFRYDTERDIYAELLNIRGVTNRFDRCKTLVEGLDMTLRDLAEEKRYREQARQRRSDLRLQNLVLLVGFAGIMQVLFQAADVAGKSTSMEFIGRIVSIVSTTLVVISGVGLAVIAWYGAKYWRSQHSSDPPNDKAAPP